MESSALILSCLASILDNTLFNQLTVIAHAMLCMNGRITMLGISRWTDKGGSYRTVQRFFNSVIDWKSLNFTLLRSKVKDTDVVILAGDVTTVTKSGKLTFGLGKFFSSIYSKPVKGIAFQCLSVINVTNKKSWPLMSEQFAPSPKVDAKEKLKDKVKKKPGRPKGSVSKNKKNPKLNDEMTQVMSMIMSTKSLIGKAFNVAYFVYDGAFGNNAAAQMVTSCGMNLISKLRQDSSLFLRYEGNHSGKGRPRKYGKKINYKNLPSKHKLSDSTEDNVRTVIYQFIALNKNFYLPLNVVVIQKINLITGAVAHVLLVSSDSVLGGNDIIEYYSARFQIEFNFRDAKQYWGLEDFMVTSQTAVYNSANIAFWMVNFSQSLLEASNAKSILDLKAHYHGLRYAKEALKLFPKNAQPFNNSALFDKLSMIGRIHEAKIAS